MSLQYPRRLLESGEENEAKGSNATKGDADLGRSTCVCHNG
jgi:hypothetical protein